MSKKKKPAQTKQTKQQQTVNTKKKQPKRKTKEEKLLEWLLSLGITLLILAVIIIAQGLYVNYTHLGMKMSLVWRIHAVSGIVMLFIVHHFVKRPENEDDYR